MTKQYYQRLATMGELTGISIRRATQLFDKYGHAIIDLVRQANEFSEMSKGQKLNKAIQLTNERSKILQRIKFLSAFLKARIMEAK